jgi:hypothetical protein
MPGSAWTKEETTQRLDLRHPSEVPNQKTQERSSQLRLYKSQQSGNIIKVQTGPQRSEMEYQEGQKILCRYSGGKAERTTYHGNIKELYLITKKLAGKYCRPERPVKDRQGQTITDPEQQLERLAEHFEELLKREAPENSPNIAEADKHQHQN